MAKTEAVVNLAPAMVEISRLQPHPRNYREHPEDQLQHIVESIREHGVYRNVIVAQDYTILAGHGVVEAAQRLRLTEIPVVRLELHPHDPRALKLLVGDNEISNLAEDNESMLIGLLKDIQEEDQAGLLGTGYDEVMLGGLTAAMGERSGGDPDDEDGEGAEPINPYSQKIETPIYTPTLEFPPEVWELYDTSHRDSLVEEITAADLDGEVAEFLLAAAERHVVFDYQDIAEYYAHATPDVQRLMEASGLVIIDIDQAIARGYVRARERMMNLVAEDVSSEL